jgi:tetratricopeptide (TPR) repeat protein
MDYMIMNRLEEAALAAGKADAKQLEGDYFLHGELYLLAFLRNDAAGMAEQVAWSTGKPEAEVRLLQDEASTAAYFGRLVKARELFRRAAASAERAELKDFPAYSILGYWAWEEALCGNQAQARQQINAALRLSRDRYALIDAGLTLPQIGETARAQTLADELGKHPVDTITNFVDLPLVRAQLAISQHDAPRAIEALKVTIPYELGYRLGPSIVSAYERGQAYLIAHEGQQAAVEFQKILDHRGLVGSLSIGALAHLGLARAYALQGETAKAIAKYQDFLAVWKDADPDIPVLKEAKAEYAKLQ